MFINPPDLSLLANLHYNFFPTNPLKPDSPGALFKYLNCSRTLTFQAVKSGFLAAL